MFSTQSKLSLAKATLTQDVPVYVQFYITARCNLACEQCNIIYSNSDCEEVSLDKIKKIADNFASLGVAIVLLTGGEPYMRKDLHEIIYEFESRGIHVRMQTNGFASEERIIQSIQSGGTDISISLDSLIQEKQDVINGDYQNSWDRALETISYFSTHLPKEDSFALRLCLAEEESK